LIHQLTVMARNNSDTFEDMLAVNAWRHLQLAVLSVRTNMLLDGCLTGVELEAIRRLADDIEGRLKKRIVTQERP
jgi:hypothetical protein